MEPNLAPDSATDIVDAELRSTTEDARPVENKKRSFIIAGVVAFMMLVFAGVLASYFGEPEKPVTVTIPQSIHQETSHTVLIQPAFTLTFAVHFVKTRWPVVAGFALSVAGIILAVVRSTVSGEPAVPGHVDVPMEYPEDDQLGVIDEEEQEVVIEEEPGIFSTPVGIAGVVFVVVVFVVFAVLVGLRIQSFYKNVQLKKLQAEQLKIQQQKDLHDRINDNTPITDIFPVWAENGETKEVIYRRLMIASLLSRPIDNLVANHTYPAIRAMAHEVEPTFYCDTSDIIGNSLKNPGISEYYSIHKVVDDRHDDDQIKAAEELVKAIISLIATVDEAQRPKKSHFEAANQVLLAAEAEFKANPQRMKIINSTLELRDWANAVILRLRVFN